MNPENDLMNDADRMLSWITHRGPVRVQQCQETWKSYSTALDEAKPSFPWVINNLRYLGHIESIEANGRRFVATPPTLLPVKENTFQWFGARIPDWIKLLEEVGLKRLTSVHEYEPALWRFKISPMRMESFGESIRQMVPSIHIALENQSLRLLKSLPTVFESIRRFVGEQNDETYLDEFEMELFTLNDGGYRSWKPPSEIKLPQGLYRHKKNRRYYWRDASGQWISVTEHSPILSVMKWDAARKIPGLLVHDTESNLLRVRKHLLRFPLLLERGLHLFSGRIPGCKKNDRCYKLDRAHVNEVFRILDIPR